MVVLELILSTEFKNLCVFDLSKETLFHALVVWGSSKFVAMVLARG